MFLSLKQRCLSGVCIKIRKMNIPLRCIGIIHTPFQQKTGMPIQPGGAAGIKGTIEIDPAFSVGLQDLDGFSHIYLIYHFHKSEGFELITTPFLDKEPRGVFATRAPKRPNPIGISIVKLIRIEGNILHIENADMLDGTPLLDIKPYVPEFDAPENCRIGWLEDKQSDINSAKSDERFG